VYEALAANDSATTITPRLHLMLDAQYYPSPCDCYVPAPYYFIR
jgi:hypothetical protein